MAKKEEETKPHEMILGLIVIGFLGFILFTKVVPAVFGFAGGLFNSSSDKEYCGRSDNVLYAKTNAAAKLAYKSCLRRMRK